MKFKQDAANFIFMRSKLSRFECQEFNSTSLAITDAIIVDLYNILKDYSDLGEHHHTSWSGSQLSSDFILSWCDHIFIAFHYICLLIIQSTVVTLCTTCFNIRYICVLLTEYTDWFPVILRMNSDYLLQQEHLPPVRNNYQ